MDRTQAGNNARFDRLERDMSHRFDRLEERVGRLEPKRRRPPRP
jgi:hypothetical protein